MDGKILPIVDGIFVDLCQVDIIDEKTLVFGRGLIMDEML